MNIDLCLNDRIAVSAGCHINDVMNRLLPSSRRQPVSAGCHINDVMNEESA